MRKDRLRVRASSEQKGVIFLVIILIIMIGVTIYLLASLKTDVVAAQISNDQVLRTLFVVDEERANEKGSHNALITCVLVYYPVSKRALVINVPGATGSIWNSIGRVDRLDAVFHDKGIGTYKKEIEALLGISIPFTVSMKIQGFMRLVDLMGGLRVFIPSPVDVTDSAGVRYLLPSGAVTLDGDKTMIYLKHELSDDTFSDRQERYQNVEVGFFGSIHEKRSVYFTRKAIFGELLKLFHTNLKHKDDIYNLFALFSELDAETIGRQTITGRLRYVDVGQLLFPLNNGDFIKEAVKQNINMLLTNSGTASARIYVLEIKNGTRTQGLAHNTAILFQNASYDVLATSNADSEYEKTVIIDHIGNAEMAKMVGDFIRCTNIEEEEVDLTDVTNLNMSAADVDFTIILGKDFDGRYVRK